MKKRILSAALCAALALGLCIPASAAPQSTSLEEAAQVLAALDIMTGDARGNLYLERTVTRAEFTKLTVAASPYARTVGDTASVSPYPDVPRKDWSAPYIQCAKERGLVRGYLDGTFRPGSTITLVEGVNMALSLLGYSDSDFSGAWGSGQMALYHSLGLDENITAGRSDPMKRADALWLFYNLLSAKTKSGQVYITSLGYTLTPSGELDRVAIINAAMEGPIVAEGDWRAQLPFDAAVAKVYRGGKAAALTDIQALDVVYYSESMHTLWAWGSRVTGSIQALSPSSAAPSAVVIGAQTYSLETAAARFDLSDLGSFRLGDTVTLLLGRGGGVAAVRTPDRAGGTLYGVVTATGTASYQDAAGSRYSAPTVYLTATDGSAWSYPYDEKALSLKAGDLIQVTPQSGTAAVKKLSAARLSGKVSTDAASLGRYAFADDVEILDVWNSSALRVYPSRLSGVTLEESDVRYYLLNERGEVSRLILDDVTGDLHRYGVLTDVTEVSMGMTLMGSYVYDLSGIPGAWSSQKALWGVKKGPCQVQLEGQSVQRIYNLRSLALTAVGDATATAGVQQFPLADQVAVYEVRDGKYYLTDLSRVTAGEYELTGWYDKQYEEGGRIRVITAKAV